MKALLITAGIIALALISASVQASDLHHMIVSADKKSVLTFSANPGMQCARSIAITSSDMSLMNHSVVIAEIANNSEIVGRMLTISPNGQKNVTLRMLIDHNMAVNLSQDKIAVFKINDRYYVFDFTMSDAVIDNMNSACDSARRAL